jgi:arylsulfatase A-like enzyme
MMFIKTMNSILALVFLSMLLSCQANDQKNTSPNVLMISIDDLNDWIGVLGVHPDVKTPNIDRLANEGVLFTNAHCQAPICGPSRASVMSGLRPSTTGIYGQIKDQNLRKGSKFMESVRFLPQYFKDQGYKTIGIGKIFHNHAPEGVFEVSGGRVRGFGPLPEKRMKWSRKGTSTDWGPYPDHDSLMYDYTYAQWTRKQLQETHDRPFFMSVGFIRPHVPWYAPQKWFDLYPPDQVTLPSYLPNDFDDLPEIAKRIAYKGMMPTTDWAIQSGEWKNIVQAYLACISFVDHQVGIVLEALENSEYKDNTIVVLWSDHGYEIGEKGSFGKHTLWSESTRVPLIFKFPRANSTQTIHIPVELLDIYPTLIDLTQLPKNPLNEGRSLLPLMLDSDDDRALAITTYGKDNHSLINQTHRYIRYEDGSEELYDLRIDPDERNNLADRIDSGPIKQAMMNRIPKLNVPWSAHSYNTVNEYFKRTSNSK